MPHVPLLALVFTPALAGTVTDEFGGDTNEQSVYAYYYGNIFDVDVGGKITTISIPVSDSGGAGSETVGVYIWLEGSRAKYYDAAWSGRVTPDSTSPTWKTVTANYSVSAGDRIVIGGHSYDFTSVGYGSTNEDNEPAWGSVVGTCADSSSNAPDEIDCSDNSGDAKMGLELTFVPADEDRDGYDGLDDCDDSDRDVNPGASETWYDGVDGDCDGGSDYDRDGDGYDSDVYDGNDCNDRDEDVHPRAADEPYDGVDADCAGDSDYDQDGDGYDSDQYGGDDCDDDDRAGHPGVEDEPDDGVDADCSGSDYDGDGDGYDGDEYGGDDCDDSDAEVNPEAEERWYDGEDADCSGGSDFDQDGDGHDKDEEGGDDCDDKDASVWKEGDDGECVETGKADDPDGGGDAGCGDGICGLGGLLVAVPAVRRLRRRR